MALKLSHNKDLTTPGFTLLGSIVRWRLLGNQRHLDDWSIFSFASSTLVCDASVHFLHCCLAYDSIPHESTSSSTSTSSQDSSQNQQQQQHPMRIQIIQWLLNFDGTSSNSLNSTSDFQSTFNATLSNATQFSATQSAKNEAILSNINSRWIVKDRNKRLVTVGESSSSDDDTAAAALPKSLAMALFALTLHEPAPVARAFVGKANWPKEVGVVDSLWAELEISLLRDCESLYNNVAVIEEVGSHVVCPILKSLFSQVLFVKYLLGLKCVVKSTDVLTGCDMLLLSVQKHLECAQSILDDLTRFVGNSDICRKAIEIIFLVKRIYEPEILEIESTPGIPVLSDLVNRTPSSLIDVLRNILSHPERTQTTSGRYLQRPQPLWLEDKNLGAFEDAKNVGCKTEEPWMDFFSRLKKRCFDAILQIDASKCQLGKPGESIYPSLFNGSSFDPFSAVHIGALHSILRVNIANTTTTDSSNASMNPSSQLVDITSFGTLLKAVGQVFKFHQQDQQMYVVCLKILTAVVQLLSQFKDDGLEAVAKLDKYKEVVMKMLLYVRSERNSFPVPEQSFSVRVEVAKIYSALARVNPDGQWGSDADGPVEAYDVLERTCEILIDKCHEARLIAARSLKLFCSSKVQVGRMQRERWDKIVEVIDGLVESAKSAQASAVDHRVNDDGCNLIESAICILITLGRYDETHSVTAWHTLLDKFGEGTHHKSIDAQLKQLDMESGEKKKLEHVIGDKLRFVLKLWMQKGRSPLSFPFELLGYETLINLLKDFQNVIVASLLYGLNREEIAQVAQKIGVDSNVLMKLALPQVVTDLLKDMVTEDGRVKKESKKKLESISEMVSQTELRRRLKDSAADIIFQLIGSLNFASDSFSAETSPSVESHLTEDQLTACFKLLGRLLGIEETTSSAVSILVDGEEEQICETLLQFSQSVLDKRRGSDVGNRRQSLRRMSYIVSELVDYGLEEDLKRYCPFILREVTTTLCQVIDDECLHFRDELKNKDHFNLGICLDSLEKILEASLASHSEFVGRLLPKLVSTLVKVSQLDRLSSSVKDKSVALMTSLIVENVTQLFPYIRGLFLLPSIDALAHIRESQITIRGGDRQDLGKEMELFFAALEEVSADELLISGLQELYSSIAELRKGAHLFEEVMQRAISQKLLTTLLAISKSENQAVRSAALKILGLIGPINARVVALPSPFDAKWKQHATKLVDNPNGSTMRNVVLLKLLDERLTDNQVSLRRVGIRCLKRLFETSKTIVDLLANIDLRERQLEEEADLRSRFSFMEYFHPIHQQISGSHEAAMEILGDIELVESPNLMNFEDIAPTDFIQRLCLNLLNAGLIRDPILLSCKEMVEADATFAPEFLIYLIHGILSANENNERVREILSNQFNGFFERVLRAHERGKVDSSLRTLVDIFLRAVSYLREQERKVVQRGRSNNNNNRRGDAAAGDPTDWDNNFWLNLDYRKIALSAVSCDQPFSALMYFEIWFSSKSLSGTVAVDESVAYSQTQSFSSVDCVTIVDNAESNEDFSTNLYRIYSLIGEPDALYGCGTVLVSDDQRCVDMHMREGDWAKAASASSCLSSAESTRSLSRSLVEMNLMKVAHAFLDTNPKWRESEDYYKTALGLSKWDLAFEPPQKHDAFYRSIFQSCSALVKGNRSSSLLHKDNAVDGILRNDILIIPQSAHALTPILAKLKIIRDLDSVQQLLSPLSEGDVTVVDVAKWNSLFLEWKADHDLFANQSFGSVEHLFHMKSTLVRLAKDCPNGSSRNGDPNASVSLFQREEAKLTFQFCKLARLHGHFHFAEGGFARVKEILRSDKLDLGSYWELEEPFLYWDRKEEEKAKYLLRGVIEGNADKPSSPLLIPLALCTMGSWLAESNMASPAVISKKYLEEAAKLSATANPTKSVDRQNLKKIRVTLGKFADEQYQSIKDHMDSSLYAEKMRVLKEQEEECARLMAVRQKLDTAHDQKYLAILMRTKNQDVDANDKMIHERKTYLEKALLNYLAALKVDAGPTDSTSVETLIFRVTTLWFDNNDDQDVNQLIAENYRDIPPHVFLPVISQLTAQLGEGAEVENGGANPFQDTLTKLIGRVCRNHPFHTVYSLLAIVNANKDQENVTQDRRMLMANGILNHLKAKGLKEEIEGLSAVCDAMIQAAYIAVPGNRKGSNGPFPFPRDASLRSLNNIG